MNPRLLSRRSALAAMAGAVAAPFVPRWGGGGALLAGEPSERGDVHGGGRSEPTWVEREAYLMGTLLRGRVGAPDRRRGLAALEAAYDEVRRIEALLSTWRSDTELARLNRARPHEPVPVAEELFGLLQTVRELSHRTRGAFDPAVGALVDAWGFRTGGRRPTPAQLAAARRATGLRHFSVDASAETVTRLHPGAWIDSGAFGKGAGLAAADRALGRIGAGSALLDFGGQLLARGGGPEGSGWPIHVAHPRERSRPVARLRVTDRSVATSGASERWVELDEARLGHVLDPRTGRPVEAWGSVTVVGADPVASDALATALFVMGPVEALRWARGRRGIGVLVLETESDGLRPGWNEAMERWIADMDMNHDDDGDEIR